MSNKIKVPGAGLAGRFQCSKFKGEYVYDQEGEHIRGYNGNPIVHAFKGTRITTAWSDNIVTDLGLNKIADTQFITATTYCHVGTGTGAASSSDTALGTFVAATNTVQSSASSSESSAPWFGSYVRTWRFGEGVAEGIIAETAVSDQATTGEAYSRALVSDGVGGTTTIQVLSDEWLDVAYDHRLYPDHILSGGGADDGTGSITISGTSYDYVIRPANVDAWTNYVTGVRAKDNPTGVNLGEVYGSDGALGAAIAEPTGSSQDILAKGSGTTVSYETYSDDTFERDITFTMGLAEANVTGGIAAMHLRTGFGDYQISLAATSGGAPLPKDDTKVWTFVLNLAWTRATIP
jgi:hypothetical protein